VEAQEEEVEEEEEEAPPAINPGQVIDTRAHP